MDQDTGAELVSAAFCRIARSTKRFAERSPSLRQRPGCHRNRRGHGFAQTDEERSEREAILSRVFDKLGIVEEIDQLNALAVRRYDRIKSELDAQSEQSAP